MQAQAAAILLVRRLAARLLALRCRFGLAAGQLGPIVKLSEGSKRTLIHEQAIVAIVRDVVQ